MSLTGECFDKVIGLTRTQCDCYEDPPAGYDESASGLYLDEAPGMNLKRIFSAADCENDGWELMTKARAEGLKRFTGEVIKHIVAGTSEKRKSSRSLIAADKASKEVSLGSTYHGVELVFANHVGGTATIHRIGGAFKFTGSVTVKVYADMDSDTPVSTHVIAATNNKREWTDITPFTVDLSTKYGDNPRLWLLFEPTAGQQALDVKVASCTCQGKPKWNIEQPYYESGVVMDGQAWTAWAMVSGTYGNDLSDRENWVHSNETQGLMLDISFACDARQALCTGTPNYDTDPHQSTFAYGVRFAAALYLVENITGSTRVIRENIVNGEQMELLRVSYTKEMNDRAEWLGQELSGDQVNKYADCFVCKDETGLNVSTMRR